MNCIAIVALSLLTSIAISNGVSSLLPISSCLLLLVTAIINLWVCSQTCEQSLCIVALFSGIMCFIYGFAQAPWAIQVLLLISLLIGANRLDINLPR